MIIRVIDLETTGVEPTDKVVEIAAADLNTNTMLVEHCWDRLINPEISIPPNLSAVHHIIDADVLNAPLWPLGALEIIGSEDGDVGMELPDAFAAHNAKFERQWVTDQLSGGRPWICTYRSALRVWPDAPGHNNQTLRYWLNPEGLDRNAAAVAHRAGPDAYVTAFTLRELLKAASFDDLVKWTGEPALLPRCSFGKHRGSLWSEVPLDYCAWIVRQADMNEDTKFTAQHHLDARKR